MASHITAILVAFITGILSPIVFHSLRFFYKKKTLALSKESLNRHEHFNNEEAIVKKLDMLKEKFKCDRAWLAEFHNGTKTYSGKSFQKFSVTYESTNEGIAAAAINTQNIPTSIFSTFFRKLMDDHYFYIKNTNAINTIDKQSREYNIAVGMESFWETRGTKSFIALCIKDISSNFVGILCLDGVIDELNLSDEDIQKLITTAYNLAGYLE